MNGLAKFIDIHRRLTVVYVASVAPLGPSLILGDCNPGRKPPRALLGRRYAAFRFPVPILIGSID